MVNPVETSLVERGVIVAYNEALWVRNMKKKVDFSFPSLEFDLIEAKM